MKKWSFLLLIWISADISCVSRQKDMTAKMNALADSIKVGDMVIYNAFKYQVLAHNENGYDSSLIIKNVITPFPELWNKCLMNIFGDAGKMFNKSGIIEWNRYLFEKNKGLMNKIDSLSDINLDSLFYSHLQGVQNITGLNASGKWILYAGPDENFSLYIGGCSSDGMAVDIAHSKITLKMLTEALPHEFEHMIFEQAKSKDPDWNTALGSTFDEGLACYFTYKYFNGRIPAKRVIEDMSDSEWKWYIDNEKEIYKKSVPYLFKPSSEKTLYQCNCRAGNCKKLFNSPKSICYFLGFKIIESYNNKNGEGSWKDIYEIPLREFYNRSGYSSE